MVIGKAVGGFAAVVQVDTFLAIKTEDLLLL